jgi:hypothetical protein
MDRTHFWKTRLCQLRLSLASGVLVIESSALFCYLVPKLGCLCLLAWPATSLI